MPRKHRADSKLGKLPKNIREQMERWMFEESHTYEWMSLQIREQTGMKVPTSTLSNWFRRIGQERMLERIAAAAAQAREVNKTMGVDDNQSAFSALMTLVRVEAFEQARQQGKRVDLEKITAFTKLAIEARKLELSEADMKLRERRLELLEKKAAQAEEAEKALRGGGDPADVLRQIREVFGIRS